jgi:hypothetical protein
LFNHVRFARGFTPLYCSGDRPSRAGHFPVLATHEVYRGKIEGEGITFAPVAPDLTDFGDEREFTRRAFATHGGIEFLIKTVVIKPFRQAYSDLDAAVGDGTDLLVTHH